MVEYCILGTDHVILLVVSYGGVYAQIFAKY